MSSPLRITVWGEFRHEKKNPKVAELYPQGEGEFLDDDWESSVWLGVEVLYGQHPAHDY